jgi:hypothetical protein
MFTFTSFQHWLKFLNCIAIHNSDERRSMERKARASHLNYSVVIPFMLIIFGLSSNTFAASTEEWTTYKNETQRYEIQVPSDLKVTAYSENIVHIKGDSSFYAIIVTDVPPIDKTRPVLSDIDLLQDIISFGLRLRCRNANLDTLNWTAVQIGGLQGIEITSSEDPCLKKHLPWAAVKRDNKIYHFQRLRGPEDTFDKIISTFQFD